MRGKKPDSSPPERAALEKERNEALAHWERWFDTPMIILGVVWLILSLMEFITSLSPLLVALTYVIWAIFIIDFLVRLFFAPHKLTYLRKNILVELSLVLPALRIVRVLGIIRLLYSFRAVRGLQLLRIFTSVNRGMRSLSESFRRHGFGYVLALVFIVVLAGAVGIYYFERQEIGDFGSALWWSAMIITTMGSGYWPQSPEGRILCLFLAVFAFSIFGYITATITSLFVKGETKNKENEELSLMRKQISTLLQEIAEIKKVLRKKDKEK